jgi:nucleoside-diphosphate-sugar epimerase
VVGAGAIGSDVARRLVADGHRVRLVTRSGRGPQHAAIEHVAVDAADSARLAEMAGGAVAIYNCANPPYHRWTSAWPPLAASILTAAERSGAVLATCSNLYGYGPVTGPIREDLPLAATGSKGRVRARMWLDALARHEAGFARVTEVRGSDYLGPRGSQSQFGPQVMRRLLTGKSVSFIGNPTVTHSWTYTGDVARLLVVVARDQRAWGRAWHVPSHPARPAADIVADLCAAAGVPSVRARQLPRWLLTVVGAFSPTVRELREVMHQHTQPWILDSSAAENTFALSPTPWPTILDEVVRSHRAGASGRASATR